MAVTLIRPETSARRFSNTCRAISLSTLAESRRLASRWYPLRPA